MKIQNKGKTPVKIKKNPLMFTLEDSIPIGETDRKKYVSDVAFFYSSIFKEKIKHFIGDQLEELSQVGRTEKGNDIIRSNINCFRLIDEWMERMTNEHIGNLENLKNRVQQGEQFINNFKGEYKI